MTARIRVVAIYRSPPDSPGAFAVVAQQLDAGTRLPEWPLQPSFHPRLEEARAGVPDGWRREVPTARDRRELPLLVEVWIEPSEATP